MDRKIPYSTGATGAYTGEGGHGPVSEPTFPGGSECRCRAPQIYIGGKVLEVCQRCGLPALRGRRPSADS
jgi:hypothetical protein